MGRIWAWCKGQPVLCAAFLAAILSMAAVPPDREYATYCNRAVLIQLFCLMLAVAGFRSVGVFESVTRLLLQYAGTVRRVGIFFIQLCFFSAMLVTNDVALLTFVPLTLLLFRRICDTRSLVWVIVLETAAANLGSMMTPIGNPQNLYLYATYALHAETFLWVMLPAGLVSYLCLCLLSLKLPKKKCTASETPVTRVAAKRQVVIYSIMFVCCIATVFRVMPDWLCLIVTVIMTLIGDHRLFAKVDYALLATFVCFFVFVGNIARVEVVRTFFENLMQGRELIVSVLLSQCISNVPAAVMLSGFTQDAQSLLLGVNIGGLGTLIASLASLISYQFYSKSSHAKPGYYLAVFSAVNFGLLLPLLALGFVQELLY